jgi:hypothetical protein
MADQNQQEFYQAQYDAIGTLFQTAESDADLGFLGTQCEAALSDPALPRYHRARCYIINAWCAHDPEPQLRGARETLDDMVQVLHGILQEEIDQLLKPLRELLEVAEESIETDNRELYVILVSDDYGTYRR